MGNAHKSISAPIELWTLIDRVAPLSMLGEKSISYKGGQ